MAVHFCFGLISCAQTIIIYLNPHEVLIKRGYPNFASVSQNSYGGLMLKESYIYWTFPIAFVSKSTQNLAVLK